MTDCDAQKGRIIREYPIQKIKKIEVNSWSTKLRENLVVKLKFRNINIPENLYISEFPKYLIFRKN